MIDAGKLRQQLRKLPKWKAFGPDKVHGFLNKRNYKCEKIIILLNKCPQNGKTPE